MFQQEKKYLSLGINADDAPFAVNGGDGGAEMINAVNHQWGTSQNGKIGYNESVPGNALMPYQYAIGVNTPFGTARDEVRNRIIYFYYNASGNHGIYCVESETGVIRTVLLSTQVRDGFGWTLTNRINEAFVIGDKLYWCDPEPRCINIEAGIRYNDISYNTPVAPYAVGILKTQIRLIKKTQNLPVLIRKVRAADVPAISTYDTNLLNDTYQFFVRYTYRDYERSVIGPYSKLAEYNYKDSVLNAIEIKFNPAEVFEQDVQIVELGVRFNNIGNGFIIKQWDRANPADNNAINSHNNGAVLTYYFLNSETGPAVNQNDLDKPFDSIPLIAKTPAVAKNRLFLGNGVFGYTAPAITSMQIAVTNFPNAGGLLGAWYKYVVSWNLPGGRHVTMPAVFIDLGPTVTQRYVFFSDIQFSYVISVFSDVGQVDAAFVAPSSIASSRISLQTANLADIDVAISKQYRNLTGTVTSLTHTTQVPLNQQVLITNNVTAGESRTFKSNSAIKTGIVFYDEDRRKCGVVTSDALRKLIPNRSYSQISFTNLLTWTLSNSNALNEIPDWAYYYAVVRTKNLTTDFFFQGHASDSCYVTVDADGKLFFTSHLVPVGGFDYTYYGLGIRLSDIKSYGIGYVYTPGDLVNLYFPARVPLMGVPVIAQFADWVILERKAIGALGDTVPILFEIYTPHKEAINEGYYEVGEIYEVTDPTLSTRRYSKMAGILNGDVYAIARQGKLFSYIAEVMSPNDKTWKNWYTDVGWVNLIDNIGQQRRPDSVCWSNVIIPGTRSNGLSSFDALDVIDLPVENGDLNKLILASKVQDEGTVLLGICENETSSMYLGETQVIDSGGNVSFTATSTTVIGTINVLKGGFGTSHPESVKFFRGNVYWFDVRSGAVIQYASNGLMPVTNYKMTGFFRKYATKYKDSGSTLPLIGGIDPYNEKYLLSLPGLEANGYAGTLPTLTDANEFEIYDGKSKTFAYGLGRDKFISTYPYLSQAFEFMGLKMYGFSGGNIYQFGSPTVKDNFFFGQQFTTKLMFLANSNPFKIKRFTNIVIEGNMAPVHCIFYSINEYQGEISYTQITDLVLSDFRNKEGNYYADILRDRLSPNTAGAAEDKLYLGDKMHGKAMLCQVEFDTSVKKLQLQAVNIGYHFSEGHST